MNLKTVVLWTCTWPLLAYLFPLNISKLPMKMKHRSSFLFLDNRLADDHCPYVFAEGWFIEANNQAMRFGDLPSWAVELSTLIHEAICVGDVNVGVGSEMTNEDEDACPLPSDLLWREPLFDQMIVNRYNPGYLRPC